MIMKIADGVRSSFRCVRNMENVIRKEIEDPAFINGCVEKNFAFLKSLPNSLPPICHTLVFQRNKRELRAISRNKRELGVTSKNKRELRATSSNKRELRITSKNKRELRATSRNKRELGVTLKNNNIASNKENPRISRKKRESLVTEKHRETKESHE
ncbi:hypothetical protein AVEN_167455-1 [Araneus ventricosus]|uniref:Uncharacterized protein n=1 Tax=Araneus ventricosus TaxID=182803 RepID=A0A4Y2EPZ3_ARAVE|nr:hypothetical protein AVEN_167455-1 [Araneus ventricosus]